MKKEEILQHTLKPQNFNIILLDEVDSTNRYLKDLANKEATEGTVVIAEGQTNGRGRFTRKFHSPKNGGIYMSILLKPPFSPDLSVLITAAAAVAVSDAVLKVFGKETEIKWVNDLLLNGKKICGILTEGAINPENGSFNWAVLGIGINVYSPQSGFPDEIKDIAAAITEKSEKDLRNVLCAEILNSFFEYYKALESRSFLESYRQKSTVLGKEIKVLKNDDILDATALEIDNDCRLLVKYKNGDTEYLSSGEISTKLK